MKKIIAFILLLSFLIMPFKFADAVDNIGQRLRGRLLLAIQQGGAVYYVDNVNYQKHLIKWDNALPIFQQFALGITDEDLLKIPVAVETIRENLDSDSDSYTDRSELEHGFSPYIPGAYQGRFQVDKNFANRLKNKFLLQVNQGGAIWYVDNNGVRHNVRWSNLKALFEKLALGITNNDLSNIVTENNLQSPKYSDTPQLTPISITQKCTDGTLYDQCSNDKPKYCNSGNLINNCSNCGCSLNYYCDKSSETCIIAQNIDMLIFLSPQYSEDVQIKQAINKYIDVVKNDIGWNTKIVNITTDTNEFRKIDKIIEDYYHNPGNKIKASIMVGEDINTALSADFINQESPATSPWSTTGGESPSNSSTFDENTYSISELNGGDQINGYRQKINIAISLIYPTHSLSYEEKSSQIITAFKKFSTNRESSYSKDMVAFESNEIVEDVYVTSKNTTEIYNTLSDYGNLYYKREPSQIDIEETLNKSFMLYNINGHSAPGYTKLGADSYFYGSYLNQINTPIFTAQGCFVAGWYAAGNTDNSILDYSDYTGNSGSMWYGSTIFTNPDLRVTILGQPAQTSGGGSYNFIYNAMSELNTGKTLAESIIGKIYNSADEVIIYGDPTFHYNFLK